MVQEPRFSALPSILFMAAALSSSSALADEPTPDEPTPEIVATFDPAALEVPESIATDYFGNIYVSLALTGEIQRIDPAGGVVTVAQLPIDIPLEPCFDFVAGQTGITYTPWGLYVNVNSCDLDARGVWWVSPWTGDSAKVASLPPEVFANGIAHRFGFLYIADSFSNQILRTPIWGGSVSVWAEDPLLDLAPNPVAPLGPNGVQFYDDELYVSNTSTGQIIAFEVQPNQTAGAARVHATLETPCDDFAFDLYGTLYCGTNPVNSIVAIHPDGESEVVLSGDEHLDGPSSMAFGRLWDANTLYINNASFPFYPNQGNPSVIALELEVPGYPFR